MKTHRKISNNDIVRVFSLKSILPLVLFSALFVCLLSTPVNELTNRLLPKKEITITLENPTDLRNEVWICNETYNVESIENYFNEIACGEWDGFWEYRDSETYNYICDAILSYGNNAGSSITFSAIVKPSGYIWFEKHPSCGTVSIMVDGEKHYLDLCSESGGREKFYPFPDSLAPIVIKISIYAVLFLLIFLFFTAALWKVKKKEIECPVLLKRVRTRDIFFLWIALYIFAVVQYLAGIPGYLEHGDQPYYWSDAFVDSSKWNFADYAQLTITTRGYLCHVIPTFSKVVGYELQIDPIYIYLIFTSLTIAWLSAYVIPQLYEFSTNRKATLLQTVVFLLVYLCFWNGTLTAVLVDAFGMVSFMSGVLFALKFWRDRRIIDGCCTGLFWAISCNYRLAYQYGILMLLIILTIKSLIARKNKHYKSKKKLKDFLALFFPVFAFLLVCTPQVGINLYRGYVGLMPYDDNGAWIIENEQLDVMVASGNMSLTYGYSGYPLVVSDDQMLSMKTEASYDHEEMLTLPQILSVYAHNPIDTLVYVAKKLMVAFDVKTSVVYPTVIEWRDTSGLLFSFLNYVVLGSSLFIIFHFKLKETEQILLGCFVGGLVLPQMFVHVEWRYFLASYILLYYFFAYRFVGEWLLCPEGRKQLIDKHYHYWLFAFVFVAFIISLTIYA